MKHLLTKQTLEQVCRLYVFGFLNIYGWGKILGGQFYRRGSLPENVAVTPLGEATAFDLAWTFMGYSYAYILFVGILQIVGAWMLLWNRTKLFGTMILMPIMTNIVVFDMVFLDRKGALVNATIYLLMLLYIIYHNRSQMLETWHQISIHKGFVINFRQQGVLGILLILLIMAVLFFIDHNLVSLVGHYSGLCMLKCCFSNCFSCCGLSTSMTCL